MSNTLVINSTGQETRVALIEDGVLGELYIERQSERGIVGNIYKGKVVRVLPGMQAAFVDIGTDKAAFLYVSDVLNEVPSFQLDDDDATDSGDEEQDESNGSTASPRRRGGRRRRGRSHEKIEELVNEGDRILVQVAKDPIGTKGARLTCHITLPGRHLVFMPTVNHIGISRRISNDRERRRLRDLIDEIRPEGSGFIVRTAAKSEPSEHLRSDMHLLVRIWEDVLKRRETAKAPALLHEDLDLIRRAARDLATNNVSEIVVDDPAQYKAIPDFIRTYMLGFECEVHLYTGRDPIFDAFGLEAEISRALKPKVWLASGAYLIIDQTEALTAIDVNTGKYVGKTNLEDTITKINLEAVSEVVYQLRLRNIGGLIIIDFIDMEQRDNRERVYQALAKALERDKARTNLLKISDFGLVEMTRKRVKENLVQQLCEPCPYCDGVGHIKTAATVGHDIVRELNRLGTGFRGPTVEVRSHPDVREYLRRYETPSLKDLAKRFEVEITLKGVSSMHRQDFKVGQKEQRKKKR